MHRRRFLERSASLAALVATGSLAEAGSRARAAAPRRRPGEPAGPNSADLYSVSLAGWSLNRRHFQEGKLPAEDFPKVAREEFDLGAIELVNTMLPSPTDGFLRKLLARADEHAVKVLLIMVDQEGDLSAADETERLQAVRNHRKWLDVAGVLGCHSIRVNTGGRAGDRGDMERCVDSLGRLAEEAAPLGLNVLCENHGGLSSHPDSLCWVLDQVGNERVGTLPDFGNFPESTDRYDAIARMMKYAKAVSAKCYDFGPDGQETKLDFERLMRIVLAAGYRGHVGIEFEGDRLSEHDGVLAAKSLLLKLRERFAGSGDFGR